MNIYITRTLFVTPEEADKNDEEEKEEKGENDGVIKISIENNKHAISITELDERLGKHHNYIAYIIDGLGNTNMKLSQISFAVSRG